MAEALHLLSFEPGVARVGDCGQPFARARRALESWFSIRCTSRDEVADLWLPWCVDLAQPTRIVSIADEAHRISEALIDVGPWFGLWAIYTERPSLRAAEVGRSLSPPCEVLHSLGVSLELPYEVVEQAADQLAALSPAELRKVRRVLQRARGAGARAVAYTTEVTQRVCGAQVTGLLTRALQVRRSIDAVIRLIDLISQHHT